MGAVSTIIPIDDEYRLEADAHSWAIGKRRTNPDKETGEYKWEPIRWYPDLGSAARGLHDMRLRLCGAETLAELAAESDRLSSSLTRALAARIQGT